MSLRFDSHDGQLKCIFEKDIVASAIAGLKERLNAKLDSQPVWHTMVLDLTQVEKIDSLGINLIVWLFRQARAAEKSFAITGCNEQLMKVFTLFRLEEQFPIEALKKT